MSRIFVGRRQHGESGAVLDQELGEKVGIQPAEVLQRIRGRKLRRDSQIERRISQRKIEIDQQGVLAATPWPERRQSCWQWW